MYLPGYFNKIKWSNGIYVINKSCTQIIHYVAAYLRIPPNKNNVFGAHF